MTAATLDEWYAALEQRHLAELRFAEMRRGLVALSTLYVERRHRVAAGGVLDGRGKRAAFAMFYGPLHFAVTRHVVRELRAARRLEALHDLGCGSGAAAAAWALEAVRPPVLSGIDLHPWALAETAWTWRWFGLAGRVRRGRLERERLPGAGAGILLAYVVNELAEAVRSELLERLLAAHGRGARVLIVEPTSRRAAPWFESWSARFVQAGGRADAWRLAAELPDRWHLLDRAAGLDHRELVARTLYLGTK